MRFFALMLSYLTGAGVLFALCVTFLLFWGGFRCETCSASFNVESNLILHSSTHISAGNSPTCPECGKRFSRMASLKCHIMIHEMEEICVCQECGEEFGVQGQLDRHLAGHDHDVVGDVIHRSYGCHQCQIKFFRLSDLREHMRQHYKIK